MRSTLNVLGVDAGVWYKALSWGVANRTMIKVAHADTIIWDRQTSRQEIGAIGAMIERYCTMVVQIDHCDASRHG